MVVLNVPIMVVFGVPDWLPVGSKLTGLVTSHAVPVAMTHLFVAYIM